MDFLFNSKKIVTLITLSQIHILNDWKCFNKLTSIFCGSRKENMQRSGYTNAERAQCVIWIFQGYGATDVQSLFQEAYRRNPTARSTIRQWREDYQERGSHNHRRGNGRPRISTAVRNQIRDLFIDGPTISLRVAAAPTRVCSSTVRNFVRKELKLYPYKLQMSTALTEHHKTSRFNFAQNCHTELRNDAGYLGRIIFSDECKFSLSGTVNKQNCRIWGTERPNQVYETLHNSPSVMVWCAMSKSGVIGPYFFENENVTGSTYKRMLRYFLFPKLQNYPENMIFQQDGAPPHYSLEVREYLDRKLPNQWIGRGGPISWPSRSPDLTPSDYLLWSYIKDKVHKDPPQSINELKNKIWETCASIGQASLQKI